MPRLLVISVRFHDGRYSGMPEWPPAPARLFQALLAGVASAGTFDEAQAALRWLEGESLEPPEIRAPISREARGFASFVPNNDRDSSSFKKVGKIEKARLFNSDIPLQYAWRLDGSEVSEGHANHICRIAESLYQLGRGVDMAWAWGDVLDEAEGEQKLNSYAGVVYRPAKALGGAVLACPQFGSLNSLIARHVAQRRRFTAGVVAGQRVFTQPPQPRFQQISYNSSATLLLYDLVDQLGSAAQLPLAKCAELVEWVRDKAFERLAKKLPKRQNEFERVLIGRGATEADKESRIQILALPSIGHTYADHAVRRILVNVPPNCAVEHDDIAWAFSGLALQIDTETGEILLDLVKAEDRNMLRHYGVEGGPMSRRWRTVTPAALPLVHSRDKLDRARFRDEGKNGTDRRAEQVRTMDAVRQALRHAGVRGEVETMRVQREPFEAHGSRAEAFAHGQRFTAGRLWHAEVEFKEPVAGPLTIGDGRYLGLGLMQPVPVSEQITGLYCFSILDGLSDLASEADCARALRRAVMARVQDCLGPRQRLLPKFFSGHEPDGAPANDPNHSHLSFVADLMRRRLIVIAPHVLQGRSASREEAGQLQTLDDALSGIADLRAGASGRLQLVPVALDLASDPLFRVACEWESVTEYRPARHHKRMSNANALVHDVRVELERRGLPAPESIDVHKVVAGPRGGLTGMLRISFRVAVPGPVVLGRTQHMGGGLFAAAH